MGDYYKHILDSPGAIILLVLTIPICVYLYYSVKDTLSQEIDAPRTRTANSTKLMDAFRATGCVLFLTFIGLTGYIALPVIIVITFGNLRNYEAKFHDIFIISIVITILYIFIVYIVITVRGRYLSKVRSLIADYERKGQTLATDYEKKVAACEKREKECAVREHRVLSFVVNKYPFQGLAEASADLKMVMYDDAIRWLENKSRPAHTSAEVVKELRAKTKAFQAQYKLMLYKYEFLLNKFPELEKYVETIDEMKQLQDYTSLSELEEDYDRTRDWLTREEYERLSVDARNQLALDNYIKSFKKSNWQIGRDYELYIGYLYRRQGWSVVQFGIEESLRDMGRDIIASKGTTTHIVQCKCWSTEKVIHENVICQLYGTAVQYELEASQSSLFSPKVIPVLFSTTDLSDTAQRFADRLGVEVRVVPMFENYPRIKCNINNGSKIYHLPFDQQYDRVKIDKPGEFYAQSVQEATAKGFRRAFRFTGLKGRAN